MKILFQGDSITENGRDKSDPTNLGVGYPKYAAERIAAHHPDIDFTFYNLGISGNMTESLRDRWQTDCIDYDPDFVSILVGVNDTWHHAESRDWLDNSLFEAQYRRVLSEIKEKTHARILIIEQFLLPVEDKAYFRADLNGKIDITRALAREFADYYIPLDGIMAKAAVDKGAYHWSDDGVHPNKNGAEFIGRIYADAISEMLG